MEMQEALTRVQSKKQRAIEVWHKMRLEDEKLAIDRTKLELHIQRLTGQIDLDKLAEHDESTDNDAGTDM